MFPPLARAAAGGLDRAPAGGAVVRLPAYINTSGATAVLMPVNLGRDIETLPDGSPVQTKVEAAVGLFDACESFVRAFYKHYQDFQTSDMRLAYSFAVEVLEKTGWKLQDLVAEVAAETEETLQEAAVEPEGTKDTREPATPQETAQEPEETLPESKGSPEPDRPERDGNPPRALQRCARYSHRGRGMRATNPVCAPPAGGRRSARGRNH